MLRRLQKALDAAAPYETGAQLDAHGQTDQLRRIAREENANLDGSFDPGSSVMLSDVLDGID